MIGGLNGAVGQLANELGINKLQFFEWKNAILSHIHFQIYKYKNKFQYEICKPILVVPLEEALKTPTWLCNCPN